MNEQRIFELADLHLGGRYNRGKVAAFARDVHSEGISTGARMASAAGVPSKVMRVSDDVARNRIETAPFNLEALRLADELESLILEVANGERKPAKLPLEPFVRAYQMLRTLGAPKQGDRDA